MSAGPILFYCDSPTMLGHCVAIARMFREKLAARVVFVVVDRETMPAELLRPYEVFDLEDFVRGLDTRELADEEGEENRPELGLGPRLLHFFRSEWSRAGQLAAKSTTIARLAEETKRPTALSRFFLVTRVALARILNNWLGTARSKRLVKSLSPVLAALRLGALVPLQVLMFVAFVVLRVLYPLRNRVLNGTVMRILGWLRVTTGLRKLIRTLEPAAIVLPEDNIQTYSRAFVVYGKRVGAPTVVVPNTIPNPLEPARYFVNAPEHWVSTPLRRALAYVMPKWVFLLERRRLFRLPPSKILALELFGLSTPAPWVLNRGGAAAIALDSEAMRKTYLDLGFPASQLRVVGDANGALLARGLVERDARRAALLGPLGLSDGKPLIVCAFPPDQYDGLNTNDFEHKSFEALVAAWMQGFNAVGDAANVIVRPHPRLPPTLLARHAGEGVRVVAHPTIELVPLADLFVASISATIRWAIACGVPVINYDCYRYRYGDYLSADGVVHVEDHADYVDAIQRFVHDPVYADELRRRQERVKAHWGMVDEGCADRLAGLVRELEVVGPGRTSRGSLASTSKVATERV